MVPKGKLTHNGMVAANMIQKSEVSSESLHTASLSRDIQPTTTKQPLAAKSHGNIDAASVNESDTFTGKVSKSKDYSMDKHEKDKSHKHKKHKKHSDTKKHKSHKDHKHHKKYPVSVSAHNSEARFADAISNSVEDSTETLVSNGLQVSDPKSLLSPSSPMTSGALTSPSKSDAENIAVDSTHRGSSKVTEQQKNLIKEAGSSDCHVEVTAVVPSIANDAASPMKGVMSQASRKVEPVTISLSTSSIVHKDQTG